MDRALIEAVRDNRAGLAVARASLAAKRAELEEELETYKRDVKAWTDFTEESEAVLRVAILSEYEVTKNKAPAPGCGVRIVKELTYDAGTATLWGYEHQMALSLNVKAFEALAAIAKLEFVEIKEVPTATISQNLDKVLEEV